MRCAQDGVSSESIARRAIPAAHRESLRLDMDVRRLRSLRPTEARRAAAWFSLRNRCQSGAARMRGGPNGPLDSLAGSFAEIRRSANAYWPTVEPVVVVDFTGFEPGSCDIVLVRDSTLSPSRTLVLVCDFEKVPPSWAIALA